MLLNHLIHSSEPDSSSENGCNHGVDCLYWDNWVKVSECGAVFPLALLSLHPCIGLTWFCASSVVACHQEKVEN